MLKSKIRRNNEKNKEMLKEIDPKEKTFRITLDEIPLIFIEDLILVKLKN